MISFSLFHDDDVTCEDSENNAKESSISPKFLN